MTAPLSQQMLQAANIIERFNTEYSDIYNLDGAWRPSELRREAADREAEEREATEREGMVGELAREMWASAYPSSSESSFEASKRGGGLGQRFTQIAAAPHRIRLVQAVTPCRVGGGSGVIRVADVYKQHRGPAWVDWELARIISCGCMVRRRG